MKKALLPAAYVVAIILVIFGSHYIGMLNLYTTEIPWFFHVLITMAGAFEIFLTVVAIGLLVVGYFEFEKLFD